ncbi:MAG: 23S rRNA (uracil(1939)-C(5))-methyltransferase RlmD [Elusimicrobia bacterium]|nr:23S rRNA (uracil(1939)-C(5))-methyltransferase RlmD [Elusimicrobiota bacterium]MDE2314420.1 23S rRNA (uracil(1939)-C(5))-methyltransferase RlmD [Elusimicrobiota bacterium]
MTPAPVLAAPTGLCRHFGECGGCSLQNLPYPEQLARKKARVDAALAAFGLKVEAVHPSPELWFYRNKMEFGFSDVYPPIPDGPPLYLGLKPKGQWRRVLDLEECRLLSPETPALLAAVRRWAAENRLPPYNSVRHAGFLRHLVVREAKNGGERMVHLITAPEDFPAESFAAAVKAAYPASTILRGVNAKVSDTASPDSVELLCGSGRITEILRLKGRELRFRISPASFFQTNTRGAEVLYGIARRWAEEAAPKKILDLYCGGGGFALSLADLCEKVAGVESNAAAIGDAKRNAADNGVANAEFYAGATETLLPALLDMKPSAAVADPPRAGLHAKAAAALRDWGPPLLIYVSCNPDALGRDLAALAPAYRAERAEMVDLFPHTEHVETIVLLRRTD